MHFLPLQAALPQYEYPQAKQRYAELADSLCLGGASEDEKVIRLIEAIEALKAQCGVPVSTLPARMPCLNACLPRCCPACPACPARPACPACPGAALPVQHNQPITPCCFCNACSSPSATSWVLSTRPSTWQPLRRWWVLQCSWQLH